MENWIKDCRYIIMPTRQAPKGLESEYQAAYMTWRKAWGKYREEQNINSPLHSDGFLIPDEMGVLFYQSQCVGFCSFTFGDLNNGPLSDSGWFEPWDDLSFKRLQNISTKAIICTQFTVDPAFAGKGQIVRWKEIISLFAYLRFYYSDKEVMAGCLNLVRGMQNSSGEDIGAIILNPLHHFVYGGKDLPAQLVAYTKEGFEKFIAKKELEPLCRELWKQHIHCSELPLNTQEIKKAA